MSLAGFPVVLFLIFMLKWTMARGKSLVERTPMAVRDDEYCMLVPVASQTNHIEGEIFRQKLIAVGIKATLTQTKNGPRLFVFPEEESVARAHLNSVN